MQYTTKKGMTKMEKLLEVLNRFNVQEHEAAEMIYAYLMECGEKEDLILANELYQHFLVSE